MTDIELTQAIVRELLDYIKATGELFWKWRDRRWFKSDHDWKSWNTRYAGKPAFTSKMSSGYKQGSIFERKYLAHRIIWLWVTGRWPDPEVDHKNHIPDDNRWTNLREATHADGMRNQSQDCRNTSGHVGVCKHRKGYMAQIDENGRHHYLGTYPTIEAAVAARKTAERKYGFHPNHGKPTVRDVVS
jgi:hypothetical protein